MKKKEDQIDRLMIFQAWKCLWLEIKQIYGGFKSAINCKILFTAIISYSTPNSSILKEKTLWRKIQYKKTLTKILFVQMFEVIAPIIYTELHSFTSFKL